MEATDLLVEVRNRAGRRVGQFPATDLDDFTVVVRANNVGSWEIVLPAEVTDADGNASKHRLCEELRAPGAGLVVSGVAGVILSGPLTHARYDESAKSPGGTWTLSGASDMSILAGVEAWPDPGNAGVQTRSNDVRTGARETLILAYVSANLGPNAIPARTNAILQLNADRGRGDVVTKSPRYQNLLELVQELAGDKLVVDVVQVGDGLQLRITDTVDRSATIRMDVANNLLESALYEYSMPGVTHVNVLGQGEGTRRTTVQRSSAKSRAAAAAWGVRIERTVDQRSTDNVQELTQAADELLSEQGDTGRAMRVVPSSDVTMVPLVDWNVGDIVAVVTGDSESSARVVEMPIRISSKGTTVGATVGDPTAFEWDNLVDARQQRTESRVSNLELNASPSTPTFPAGTSIEGYWLTEPLGYLYEDGRAVSRATYAGLFDVIGTAFGPGDGSTTFNLPNHGGRVAAGIDGTPEFAAIGKTGGAKTHTLTTAEMPAHTHTYSSNTGTTANAVGDGDGMKARGLGNMTSGSAGLGGAHNNLQPYIVKRFAIKF